MSTEKHVSISIPGNLRACTGERSRYSLDCAAIVPREETGAFACACDGRIAAIVACDGFADRARFAPADALPGRVDGGRVALNGAWETTVGKRKTQTTLTPADSEDTVRRFPRLPDALPPVGSVRLTVDVKLLAQLAGAIATDGKLTLLFEPEKDNEGQLCVDGAIGACGDQGVGVIMPCTNETDRPAKYAAMVRELASVWPKATA